MKKKNFSIYVRPETAEAMADLLSLRRERLRRRPKKTDVLAEAIELLLDNETMMHPYRQKAAEEGERLTLVDGEIRPENMEMSIHKTEDRFILTCGRQAFCLRDGDELRPMAIADVVARFYAEAPCEPLMVEDAEEFAIYHALAEMAK